MNAHALEGRARALLRNLFLWPLLTWVTDQPMPTMVPDQINTGGGRQARGVDLPRYGR